MKIESSKCLARGGMLRAAICVCMGFASVAAHADPAREAAKTGWATQNGGTRGGSAAAIADTFVVNDARSLKAALKASVGAGGRLIYVQGVIDPSEGVAYTSKADMKLRARLDIPAKTSIIGVGADAWIIEGYLLVKGSDVIIRNLNIENPWDPEPLWDPTDGKLGNWNSEFDGLTVDGASNVWLDHLVFTDGRRLDDRNEVANGRHVQHHDGALDVKNGANYVTISHTFFDHHEKNTLIGSTDKPDRGDVGKLKVTIHDSLFNAVAARGPRVRYGQVHLFNNLHLGDKADADYPFNYAHGVAIQSAVVSENNDFQIGGASGCKDVVQDIGGGKYRDRGSLLNGTPLICKLDSTIGWTPPYSYGLLPIQNVAASVLADVGTGHL
ncbi:pectate lyase [Xanthomonas sp. Leaf131]|nr:pectate lyase [Xanthomonas sp. Leaf131]